MAKSGRKSSFSMEIIGLEDMRAMLNDIAPRQANSILRQTVHGVAARARDLMKEKVPVRTGALKKSIRAVRKRGTPNHPVSEVRGGATAPYMHMVEYGTKRTKAQPFIRPTIDEMRGKLGQIYREEFGKKLEKSLAREARRKARRVK